ncbi:MAG TPA: SPOR domain-containing protein, partial [Ottowia sp.]|nr:SPOR domain-containing protein [Ottowia sp.]
PAPAVAAKPPAPAQLPSRAPSNDPLGELAAARAGTATAPAADPFTYFVQAGAFRTQEDADGQRARLSLMGVEARVTEREQAGRTVYRVRVGPFQNKDAADRVKDRLDGNGFDSALVRVQR